MPSQKSSTGVFLPRLTGVIVGAVWFSLRPVGTMSCMIRCYLGVSGCVQLSTPISGYRCSHRPDRLHS